MQFLDTESQASSFKKPELIDWERVLDPGKSIQKASNARPLENRPQDILDSWMVVEALSPEGYKSPQKLAIDLNGAFMGFQQFKGEPWFKDPYPKSKNKSVYYLVYLGAIRLEFASQALLDIYGDERNERDSREGFAALGLVVLNEYGVPVPDTGLSLSSFGWAYGRALKTNLDDLKYWGLAEQKLKEALSKFIYRHDSEGKLIPLALPALQNAYDWMIQNCAIPEQHLVRPEFAIRLERKTDNTPDTILNSFYLEDLDRVKKAMLRGEGGDALKRYLGVLTHKESVDLLNSDSNQLIQKILQPGSTPLGRWPGRGRHPLVLLQQTAVNLAFQELQDTGVFSVNGPPGTGKTTLLRDIVAGILVKRAEAMCNFADPLDAFKSVDSMETTYGHVHFYKPDSRLLGHEIIVASSNNNAVENITKELPLKKAIADDLQDFRYFKTLSDALSGSEDSTWGLIAAVLGNSANRSAFCSKGWMDGEVGLRAYINSILKATNDNEEQADTIPTIVTAEDAPEDIAEAKQRWIKAKAEFESALQRSRTMTEKVQGAYEAQKHIDELTPLLSQAEQQVQEKERNHKKTEEIYQSSIKQRDQLQESLASEREREKLSNQLKPGFIRRLFKWSEWKKWQANNQAILEVLLELQSQYSDALKALKTNDEKRQVAQQEYLIVKSEVKNIQSKIEEYNQKIRLVKHYCGDHLISEAFWQKGYAERQKSSPNFSREANLLRDDVFVAAIRLHKAFIDAASKKLKHNLRLFFGEIAGDKIPQEKRRHLPFIWQTLFLVVPVISTTFASVGRMLKDLPQESIGWLLVDEAGQAKPQEAVGAIYRARRVMPVGDPLQVQPIEPLPLSLVENVARYLGVDAFRWMAPHASVQTVSDRANRFGATIERDDGEVRIGSPLIVHRRCDDPMFSISNKLAYAGMMVQAATPEHSPIADVLGRSQWFDIAGNAHEKWCPEEGDYMQSMIIKALQQLEGVPDFYVISPFKIVAQNAFRILNNSSSHFKAKGIENPYDWLKKRVGTVHTFQGKEADTVILLLGATAKEQNGARNWATSQPNLLNVAVSRAKRNLYVIGNKSLWGNSGCMKVVREHLDKYNEPKIE